MRAYLIGVGIKVEKAILAILSIILIAGCIGESSSGTGLAGSSLVQNILEPDEPAQAEIPKLPIGLTLSVGEPASTSVLAVTVKEAEIVKSYDADTGTVTAPEGRAFILIDATIQQNGPYTIDAGRDKFFVTGKDMVDKYGGSYAGTDGLIGTTALEGGKAVSGKAVFEIPETLEGPIVVYEFGTQITVTNMVGWKVR